MKTLIYFLIGFLFLPVWLCGQDNFTQFRYLGQEQGLTNNSVSRVVQDAQGFIWVGTYGGLFRYDGKDFKPFRTLTSKPYSVGDIVHDLFIDIKRNDLYISTSDKGLFRINLYTHSTISLKPQKHSGIFNTYALHPLGSDSLLISSNDEIALLNLADTTFTSIDSSKCYYFSEVSPASDKVFYCVENKIFSLNPEDGKPKQSLSLPFRIKCFLPLNDTSFLIGTWSDGLSIYDTKTEKLTQLSVGENIHQLLRDKYNNIWVASITHGFGKWNPKSLEIEFIQEGNGRFGQYSSSSARTISEVGELLWIGSSSVDHSFSDVINIYDPSINNFKFNPLPNPNKNKTYFYASDFRFRNGKMYIPRWGDFGIDVFDEENKHVNYLERDHSLADCIVDREMFLWSHSFRRLYRTNLLTGQRVEVDGIKNSSVGDRIIIEMLDKDQDQLWLATSKGLWIVDKKSLEVSEIKLETLDGQRVGKIASFLQGNSSTIWIATDKGLVSFNTDSEKYEWKILTEEEPLFHEISAMVQDHNQSIWLFNHINGLLKYDPSSDQLKHFTTDDGLADNRLYFGIMDHNNNLWAIHQNGLSNINTKHHHIVNYNIRDGLKRVRADLSIRKREDGTIFISGYEGFYSFHPDSLFSAPRIEAVISSIKINNNEASWDTTPNYKKQIELSHKENNISIGISLLDYYRPGHAYQKWKMVGLNEDWLTGKERGENIGYYGLPPGEYTFMVKAVNAEGKESEHVSTLNIIIRPPFWLTWWFQLLMVSLFLGLITWLYKRRTNAIRRQMIVQKRMAELELTALRSQMNPHFIFNTLNSIKAYILKNEPRIASEYLSTFAHLIRQTLQQSSEVKIALHDEIQTLHLYIELENMRFKDGFEFTSLIDPGINTKEVMIPPLLLQPYIENAIWHGLLHKEGSRKLSLKVFKKDCIQIVIEDNGIGRDQAQLLKSKSATKYKSMGMRLTQDRITISNHITRSGISVRVEDLYAEKQISSGTRVIISIPAHD